MADLFPITDPGWIMCCVLALILGAPLLFERIKVPPLVGMVVAGMVVGPCGLGILARDDSFRIFGQVGLYYIMFTAGLSMDTSALKTSRKEVVTFGLLSFGIPFVMGYGAGCWLLDMSGAASVLVACILSSHTMVAFSIVSRYGLRQHRSVTLSVVATMISLVLSLFILAVLSGSSENDSTFPPAEWGKLGLWGWTLLKGGAFVAAMVWALPRITRLAFRKLSDDVLQYIFVMCVMLLMAAICDSIGLEGVLGAFLCGLVMGRYIPEAAPLMRHIDFMGNALFIPYFLIGVGMLIDVRLMFESAAMVWVTVVVVGAALLSKCLSAVLTARIFRLGSSSRMMMCGLTSAHAAGALAIVMVGRELKLADGSPLVDDTLLNAVVMLILFSCVFSAFVTSAAARRISLHEVSEEERQGVEDKMLVALAHPDTMPALINAAILMRPHRSTTPIVGVRLLVDALGNERELHKARSLVNEASAIAASAGVSLKKVVRSSVNPITGLSHLMKDFETSEIVMGYGLIDNNSVHTLTKYAGEADVKEVRSHRGAESLGSFINEMLTVVSRQITIVHTTQPLNTVRRIHVVVPNMAEKETGFIRWLNHVLRLARQLDCDIAFHCSEEAWQLITQRQHKHYAKVKAHHETQSGYTDLEPIKAQVNEDHLVVFVAARVGSASFMPQMNRLATIVSENFRDSSIMIIYPDQYGVESHNAAFSTGLK